MMDPRIFEQAVNATMRVREDISGSRSSVNRPIAYGLLVDRERGSQYLIIAAFLDANFFQGPQFAIGRC